MYEMIETCQWLLMQWCPNMLIIISCVLFEHNIHSMFQFHSYFKFAICFRYMFCYEMLATCWYQYIYIYIFCFDRWSNFNNHGLFMFLKPKTWSLHFIQWNLNMRLKLEYDCMVSSHDVYGFITCYVHVLKKFAK
jgi:hypothetical protein